MNTMRVIVLIAVVSLVGCDPGPLPAVSMPPDNIDYRKDWFPTDSDDPFPLDEAILGNRINDLRKLLEQGADPNLRWGQSGDHFPLQEVLDSPGYGISDHAEGRSALDYATNSEVRSLLVN